MLGYLPYNETATIVKQGEVDSWGIKAKGETIILPCYVREIRESERMETVSSDVPTLTYTTVFEGKAPVNRGDSLLVDGVTYKIRSVRYMKDLDRNIIATKVMI